MGFQKKYGPWGLITGASAGLGASYAKAMAKMGLNLVLVARREERLQELAEELESNHGISTLCIPLDLTLDSAVDTLEEKTQGLEIGLFINNAGFGYLAPFLHQKDSNISKMIRLNCEAPARLSRLLLAPMAQRKRGGMVVLASAAAYLPTPPMSVYGATKGFDLLLGESLAMEMRTHGVDVLVVSPGHTDTEFHGVAGVQGSVAGGTASPEDVVEQSFRLLGKRISFVQGGHNFFLTWITRFFPRSIVARLSFQALKNR